MNFTKLTDKDAVIKTISECDQLGRSAFLKLYEYGPAKNYYLIYNGKAYDSKAIVGVAFGIQFPDRGPLKSDDFSGGHRTVQKKLEELGFMVLKDVPVKPGDSDPIILTQAEVTEGQRYDDWMDAEGERYHYPNGYKNRIVTGKRFLYYRGVRRKGGSRGTPEYFGTGVIGKIYRDDSIPDNAPKKNWKWFCEIEDYRSFPNAVPAKPDGKSIEQIPQNLWGVAVRYLSEPLFRQILTLSGIDGVPPIKSSFLNNELSLPIADVVSENESLVRKVSRGAGDKGTSSRTTGNYAPKDTKKIGDLAELIVYYYLEATLPADDAKTLRWVADAGEKPGWDIEYQQDGKNIGVEVKGTTAKMFPSIQITANELYALTHMNQHYRLVLVAEVYSKKPKIQFVENPSMLIDKGSIILKPLTYKVDFIDEVL